MPFLFLGIYQVHFLVKQRSIVLPLTMTTHSQSIRCHNIAVTLNNIGVILLERQLYYPAIDTLKDAIAVMKSIVPVPIRLPSNQSPLTDKDDIEATLLRARNRLRRSQSTLFVPPVEMILVQETGRLSTMKAVLHRDTDSTFVTPIRIDLSSLDCGEASNFDSDTSTILYNLGLTILCLSRVTASTNGVANQMRDHALKIFDYCRFLLSVQIGIAKDVVRKTYLFLIYAMALKSSVQIFLHQNRLADAEEARLKLVHVGALVHAMELTYPELMRLLGDANTPAAAA
jgi:hypothetical protein